ncbi:holin [Carnobacterium maltaromaticum]|uniref:holin n=1 Tax=Carnobacterium maltaromaticum TaxID=2751 RepID=UPI0012FAD802|nr:holin [Carnobacterium maltaromaticum]
MNILELIEQSTQSLIAVVAVTTGLGVWGMKTTEVVSSKYLPIASMVLGGFLGGVLGLTYGEPTRGAVDGVIAGGFASGGYDAIKSFLTGKEDK